MEATHIEPRWPVIIAILAVLSLQALLPDRIRAFPSWVPFLLAIVLIVPMVALTLTSAKARWLRIESIVILFFFMIGGLALVKSWVSALHNGAPLGRGYRPSTPLFKHRGVDFECTLLLASILAARPGRP